MGDFKEHILFGFLAAALVSYFLKDKMLLTPVETFVSSIAIVVGSVLPDIDHKNAYVHRAAKAFFSIGLAILGIVFLPLPLHLRFAAASALFLMAYIGFSSIKMQHRGFTHSISFTALVSSAVVLGSFYSFSSTTPGIAMALGILSHLALDQEFKLA
ncbi:MAG: metal-dependent hydrolase [Candidatus Nanohaloarchaea archaeon]